MENLEAAVQCALCSSSDATMKTQATQYCEQIRNSNDGWQICLNLFIKEPQSTSEVRYFTLQVVEEVISNRYDTLEKSQQDYIKQTLWDWISVSLKIDEKPYIKNKLAQTIVQIFKNQYPKEWSTFFDDITDLVSKNMETPRSTLMIDFFLRICTTIDEEVVSLLINRASSEHSRNTMIKDTMRENAVIKLTDYWIEILMSNWQTNPTIANKCLNIISQYVSWIDIKLIVTDNFMSALYQFMTIENLRMAAAECLCSIVSKGMRPLEKLQLIQLLNIPSLLEQMEFNNIDFEEQIAKLINSLGVELTSICDVVKDIEEAKNIAFSHLQTLFPYILKLLANEYDDTSSALFPLITSYTNLLKQQKKIGFPNIQNYQENVLELLKVIISKMKYDEDSEYTFGEDEDEALFIEMRKNLKVFFDAIFAIEDTLSTSTVFSVVCNTFNNIQIKNTEDSQSSNTINVSWSETELALYLIYIYGESKRSNIHYETGSVFCQMIEKMLQSNVIYYPHPSIPIIYFEIITRYSNFFDVHAQFIPNVLEAFVCNRGLQNPEIIIKTRLNYLFCKFIKQMKGKIAPYIQTVLTNIQNLLIIQPVSVTFEEMNSNIYNDLNLFEAVGILISMDSIPMDQQAEYLGTIVQPMLNSIEEIMTKSLYRLDTPKNMTFTHQLNHIIHSIGSISQGFPNYSSLQLNEGVVPPSIMIYNKILESILIVLEQLSDRQSIRESVRFMLQRFIPCMGNEIIKFIIPVMNTGMLTQCTKSELVTLLTSFFVLLIHKFKNNIYPILNELIYPIVERIFIFLNQQANGTDEIILMLDLRKAYMNFLSNIFGSSLQNVLISETNSRHLSLIMESVIHCARDSADVQSQKEAITVLSKMINVWGGIVEINDPSTNIVPGFVDFIYQQIITLEFEIVMKDDFNFENAESLVIFNELSQLHLTILQKQGVKYVEYLLSIFLPSINCPAQAANEFIQMMQNSDKKTFAKYLKKFFRAMKS